MTNTAKLFSNANHTKIYQQFRPSYPKSLYKHITSYHAKYCKDGIQFPFGKSLDLGCGSLQNTKHLMEFSKHVIATDVEENQIERAKEMAQEEQLEQKYSCKLELKVSPAEDLSFLPNQSIELVTVAQAMHWFQFDTFWKEMDRVLKPGGIFVCWCYQLNEFHNQSLQKELIHLYRDILGPYWSGKRALIDSHYATVEWPTQFVQDVQEFQVRDSKRMRLADYTNYLRTWSSYQTFRKQNPDKCDNDLDPVVQFEKKALEICGFESSEEEVEFEWPMYGYIMHKKGQ